MKGEVFLNDTNEKDQECKEKGLRGASRNDQLVMVRKRKQTTKLGGSAVTVCCIVKFDWCGQELGVGNLGSSWPRDTLPHQKAFGLKLHCKSAA